VNVEELFDFITALEGSQEAGRRADGIVRSFVLAGVEYGQASDASERSLRALWKRRRGGGSVPLVLIADDPAGGDRLKVLGPAGDGPVRTVRAEGLRELISYAAGLPSLQAVRHVAEELERLDAEGIAGVVVRGLGTEHLFRNRLPASPRWKELTELAPPPQRTNWRDVLTALGYEMERLPDRGFLASAEGRPVLLVHPKRTAAEFARIDEDGRLPEGALIADCNMRGARYGLLAAGPRMRLLRAQAEEGGLATRYLELDAALVEPEFRPLLGLLSPAYLAKGKLADLFAEARDYGSRLRLRLDRALREQVLPMLGRELGRWAAQEGMDLADDDVRGEIERAALTFVFRILFLLYAESAGYLPMANEAYAQRSMTRIAQRAAEELEDPDRRSTRLWRSIADLVTDMREGHRPSGVPAYNGALFAPAGFDGAELLERASMTDAALAPALVALARDPEDPEIGVDFFGLEISHLGHIYEGLLSLRLSVADRDLAYDPRNDRYLPADDGAEPEVKKGELVWLTNEGGRKGAGVYYTRSELVRHLVRGAVRPAFGRHLKEVRAIADSDPEGAAAKLFDFYVLDPACGSAHFLVEVVNELADQIAALLGEVSLPATRLELDAMRATAGATIGVEVDDAALLKRLALKRCVYGVDLSPMGAEIAKVSLWLETFVPGLSLAYLDHNVQVGNSLVGVARPEALAPPEEERGTQALFDDTVMSAIAAAAGEAAKLREIDDRTPAEVASSEEAARELRRRVSGAERLFDLWTAEPLGFEGVRDERGTVRSPRREVAERAPEIAAGEESPLAQRAAQVCREHSAFHWPLAFAEVFARARPGFDVVVGNPPWEEVTVEELAFFARYRPGIRSLPERPRRAAIEELKAERPELVEALERERERLEAMRRYLGPAAGYARGAGDPDLYKLFCQRYRELLRPGGTLGVVLPRNAFLADGSRDFRRWLFEAAAPRRIDFLLNAGRWAFDSEPRYTVALLTAERREPEPEAEFEVAGVAASAAQFAEQASRPGLRLRREALGAGLEVPLLPSQAHADLLAKLRRGVPFPHGCGRWRCFPVRELDESLDKELWEGAEEGRPLWKGESFDQFDPHGAEARRCPASEEALAKARKPRPGAKSLLKDETTVAQRRAAVERTIERARVAFRDVTNRTNSRTVIACLVPPGVFLVNSAPYLAFIDDDPRAEAACLALMNSLVFDWQARRFVETHLNFFLLEGLRLPPLDDDSFTRLAAAAARLSCPDERFAEFAATTGVECGALDDAERLALRAETDALVARAWGLTADELEFVFTDFTEGALPPDHREAVRKRFAEPT